VLFTRTMLDVMASMAGPGESLCAGFLDGFAVVRSTQRPRPSRGFALRLAKCVTVLLGVACLAVAGAVHAAGEAPARSIVLRMSGAPELTVAPQAQAYQPPLPPGSIAVVQDRVMPGARQRERNPVLAADMFVVVGVDAQGSELARVSISDPRVIRAETVGPSGELESQRMLQGGVAFSVLLPDEPGIVALRIYKPRWTGEYYVLDYFGETALR